MGDFILVIVLFSLFFGALAFLIFVLKSIYKAHKNPSNVLPFNHIEGIKFLNPQEVVNVEILEDSVIIYQKKETILSTIPIKTIENVLVLQEFENTEKNKSVIGRAVVGGLLLGPVGAIVGGMSGTSKNQKMEYYLEITSDNNKILLKPFMNSENIANVIKNKIMEIHKNLQ